MADQETMFEPLYTTLKEKKLRKLRSELIEMNEVDVAAFMESLDTEKMMVVFRLLPKDLATDVFSCMEIENQTHIINSTGDRELQQIIEDLFVDDAVDMIDELPAIVVKRILKTATPQTRNLINQFLNYPDNSAGSIMTAEYVALKKHMTVEQSFAYIRANGVDKETIYTCYVTSDKRELEGVITLKDLLMNPYETVISDIMDTNVIKTTTTIDQEEASELFNKYDLLALPVVDNENRLVGIITVDDVLDVMEAEATEDMEKMAAILPSDKQKPYLKQTSIELWKSRIPWLLLLMISATFTGMIITSFEDSLQKFVVLTAYIPMLMDTGGNSGSQASVTVIRGISLKDIEFKDIFRVIWKEIRVATLCGLTLGLCNFVKLLLLDRLTILVAATICLTLIVTIFCAKLVGCTLPLIAFKLGFDPAVMASPFITTIVDAISLIVYFQFATHLLGL